MGWYNDDNGTRILDPKGGPTAFTPTVLTMVGIAEYNNSTNSKEQPVTIKLETGTSADYFIGYNRAVGTNEQNEEAVNEVTIVEAGSDGTGYSQRDLKATLVAGESHIITNFGGTGKDLNVTATAIDSDSEPGIATITVAYDDLTPALASEPTNSITNVSSNYCSFTFLETMYDVV